MKLLQKGYNEIQALEIELRILEQTSAPPSRPRKLFHSIYYNFLLINHENHRKFLLSQRKPPTARDGYFIFCYGDCNRKFEEALSASRSADDDDTGDNILMKKFWLEIYNRHYKYK